MSKVTITLPSMIVKALNVYNVKIPNPDEPTAPQSFQELIELIVKQKKVKKTK